MLHGAAAHLGSAPSRAGRAGYLPGCGDFALRRLRCTVGGDLVPAAPWTGVDPVAAPMETAAAPLAPKFCARQGPGGSAQTGAEMMKSCRQHARRLSAAGEGREGDRRCEAIQGRTHRLTALGRRRSGRRQGRPGGAALAVLRHDPLRHRGARTVATLHRLACSSAGAVHFHIG